MLNRTHKGCRCTGCPAMHIGPSNDILPDSNFSNNNMYQGLFPSICLSLHIALSQTVWSLIFWQQYQTFVGPHWKMDTLHRCVTTLIHLQRAWWLNLCAKKTILARRSRKWHRPCSLFVPLQPSEDFFQNLQLNFALCTRTLFALAGRFTVLGMWKLSFSNDVPWFWIYIWIQLLG